MKAKRKSGARGMKERRHHESQLWWPPEWYAIVKRAADLDRRPLAQFTMLAALEAAERFLERIKK